jgi:hypothetical protein
MPTNEVPVDVNEPKRPNETAPASGNPADDVSALEAARRSKSSPILGLGLNSGPRVSSDSSSGPSHDTGSDPGASSSPVVRGSRWIDYDTHELLEMIGELEDERRWARLREGLWLAILIHIILISVITWIPMYVLKVPKVVNPFDVLKQRESLSYLNLPPDALRELQHKAKPKVAEKPPAIDKQTLDELKRQSPPTSAPPPQQAAPAPARPQSTQPIPPNPQSQSQIQAPQPAAVPARPNFSMNSQNPADALQNAMRNAMRSRGSGNYPGPQASGGLPMHPGAGAGGVQILSDTQGVDFNSWLNRWYYETYRTWDPLIPEEVNPPIDKQGQVMIRFKVLPNGRLMDGSLVLEGRSGDVALDRAAWGALVGSNYPPLPKDFHGPFLELRALFLYNERQQ